MTKFSDTKEYKDIMAMWKRLKIYGAIVLAMIIMLTIYSCANAATTYATVNAQVRAWLYESNPTYSLYTDTQINYAISNAQEFIIDSLPNSCHSQMFTTAAGTASVGIVTVPTDLRKIIAAEFNGIPAIQLKYSDLYARTPKATASSPYFMIIGGNIQFYPATSSAYKIVYMKKATAYVSSSTALSIADEYAYMVTLAALQEILMVDNQMARAAGLTALIQGKIQSIREAINNTNVIEATTATGTKN